MLSKTLSRCLGLAVTLGVALATAATAQFPGLTLPASGGNQKASVSQWIGPVEVSITYNSPGVTGPNGEDRTGAIWGQLVPYGMANLGFGTCGDQCPWRAGSNENTVFAVSHDVLVQGEPLAAGSYGLHMIPGEKEWTLILSRNDSAWGSFFYDAAEDALRVTVEPREHAYTHWLNYTFVDRQPEKAVAALQWENLEIPWTVEVPAIDDLYVAALEHELQNAAGFNHLAWAAAAAYTVQAGSHLDKGLEWATAAVESPFFGQADFPNLSTLARVQIASGLDEEAKATLARAVATDTATVFAIHGLGRQLLGQGETDLALQVFQANAERHPDTWPVNVGLARGYSAKGDLGAAANYLRKALQNVPEGDTVNKANLESQLERLESGQPMT